MSKKREPKGQVDRRNFLKMVGVASAAITMPVGASAAAKM